MMGEQSGPATRGVLRWHVEAAVAAILGLVGVIVVADSLRVGAGWAADGPEPGFFPFFVGLMLTGSAAWTLVRQVAPARRDGSVFVDRPAARAVLGVLLPAILFVAAAHWIGLYLAAFLLIAAFMRWHGGFSLLRALATAAAIILVLFVTFEIWFVTPLPKGPIEEALGF